MKKNDKESGNNLADFSPQITKAVETAAGSIVAIDARPRVATSGSKLVYHLTINQL